jgi:hypothetical protein
MQKNSLSKKSTQKRNKKPGPRSSESESLRLLYVLTDAMREEEDFVETETGVRPSHSDVVSSWRAGSSQKATRQYLIDLCRSRRNATPEIPGARSAKDIQRALGASKR